MSISVNVSASTVSATVAPGLGPASGWSGTFEAEVTYDGDPYNATFTITNGVITAVDLGEPI